MKPVAYSAAAVTLLLAAVAFAAAADRDGAGPGSAAEYCRVAREQRDAGQTGPAIVAYNRAIAVAPSDPQPYIGLAVLYEGVDRSDLAVEALEQLAAANPRAAHLPCRLAEAYLGAEDVRTALRYGEWAAAAEPECPRAWSVLGISQARQRQWVSAAESLERAGRLAPDDTGISDTLIEVYLQKAAYSEAIRLGQALLTRHPGSARLHYKIGWAYARLPATAENTRETERWLQRAAELEPSWFEPWAELGRWQSSLGRVREATASFEKAWRLSRSVPGVAYNLARLWRAQGDPRAAQVQREFQRLLEGQTRISVARYRHNSVPDEPQAALKLSEFEGELGQLAPALHRLRKMLRQNPANIAALRLYARLEANGSRQLPGLLRPGPGIAPAQL